MRPSLKFSYNGERAIHSILEIIMGNSLHNKIHLGRRSLGFHSRGMQILLFVGTIACATLIWLALRAFH